MRLFVEFPPSSGLSAQPQASAGCPRHESLARIENVALDQTDSVSGANYSRLTSRMVGIENSFLVRILSIQKSQTETWTTSLEITAKCNSRTAKAVAICKSARRSCTSGPILLIHWKLRGDSDEVLHRRIELLNEPGQKSSTSGGSPWYRRALKRVGQYSHGRNKAPCNGPARMRKGQVQNWLGGPLIVAKPTDQTANECARTHDTAGPWQTGVAGVDAV
jgi:hypothetical protein